MKRLRYILFTFFIMAASYGPNVEAARVFMYTPSDRFAVWDKKIIEVRLDTEGRTLNALEGLVGIYSPEGPVFVRELSVGGSAFSLWPNKPSLSRDGNNSSISFVGGQPGGVNSHDALLFTIAVTAEQAGSLYVVPVSLVGYLHDGQGTPLTVAASDITLTIKPAAEKPVDEWENLVLADHEPPLPFTITLGRDASVEDGRWFISFNTTDTGSGIDHYEVTEGNRAAVRSGTTYVLQNQLHKEKITVTAFDKAGNVRTATFMPDSPTLIFFDKIMIGLALVALVMLVLLCVVSLWRKK